MEFCPEFKQSKHPEPGSSRPVNFFARQTFIEKYQDVIHVRFPAFS
jgi:hypothetical protein